ncbi:MAG TPA: proline dehydrogenase family protein [Phycisphaerales bacterium]|nr:proline dehydrogenase family protein [Phycisphaerales bacterium]HMP38216.1 proline dehydrogenase family protein [Phycisphaerales bacterium]
MALFFKSRSGGKASAPAADVTRPAPSTSTGSEHADLGVALPVDPAHEARISLVGTELLESARANRSGMMSRQFWSDKLMDWSMKDEAFKVQLFRFVDAFPMLRTPEQIHEHLVDYLTQPGVTPPPGLDLGLRVGGLAKGLLARTMSGQITGMAEKFIAGTDARSALPKLRALWKEGLAFSVDLLGEACVSDEEALAYRAKYLDLVENLPAEVATWSPNPRLERDHIGPIPRCNVSIKISSLHARTDPIDTEGSIRGLMEGLRPILEAAQRRGVLVNFDMEQSALKDLTLELFMRCCEAIPFEAGLAMQAYLRSGDDDARRVVDWAKRTGRAVTVRLVKGAYWDYETILAEQQGWPVPVWGRKRDTDACFERMASIFIGAMPRRAGEGGVKLALGSHNARSIAHALAELDRHGLPTAAIELQMLHGMADQLKAAAAERGLRVREYVPVGEMIPGMAYLVRRLLENTSNESWLKAGFLDNAAPEALLASPHRRHAVDPAVERIARAPERHALSPAVPGVGDGRPFFTEPMRDFSVAAVRKRFAEAVRGASVPVVANDGTADAANQAIESLHRFFPRWRDTDPRERAAVLVRAAAIMRDRRDELSGVVIRESGKPWREADADVCEAIDFCEYYARMAVPLFEPERLGRFVGELDEQWYQPRGVAAVIAPWNFPLAICAGMTVAALVCGNTVAVKPAEQTPGIARRFVEILLEAGTPRDAIAFLAGPGETVGAALVRHPRTALIAFTGSMAVGLDIIEAAGRTDPRRQSEVKKVICEMGGKNAIIVDASADLDEAVLGVRHSAFGFCGQKCSACSRVIVVESAHDHFLHRLVESTRSLVIGDPIEPGTDVGPVIDAEAAERIRRFIEIGRSEGRVELELPIPAGLSERVGKPYVGPTIISGIQREHRLANEEIFGPVLAVMRASSFDEALELANATSYKLTGGVFSRKPSHLSRARREYRVGNLYLNRGITGALVGRQPFGGFGMSGVGSKAGGSDYLLQFVEPRALCENTMRRGFAPGL